MAAARIALLEPEELNLGLDALEEFYGHDYDRERG